MRWSIVLTSVLCASALASESPESDGWKSYAPRDEISPEFFVERDATRADGKPSLGIRHDERPGLDGAWIKSFPIEGGRHYRISVRRQTSNVSQPTQRAYVDVRWTDSRGNAVLLADDTRKAQPDLLTERETKAGWTEVSDVLLAPPEAALVTVELYLRWAPGGMALWTDFEIEPAEPVKRLARLATVHLQPEGATAMEKYRAFEPLIAEAAAQKADLIVLPETINHYKPLRQLPPEEIAEPIPGPATEYFGELAARHDCYIVVPIFERAGPLIYNTAALVGPDGQVAGKYREVCLARNEVKGICAGTDYPVFETRFGKVGIMICWEVHFPEPARALANNGAEVIAVPVWGGMPALMKARAIENQVYVVTSSYTPADQDWMISGVWGPDGEVLGQAKEWGSVTVVEVDLNKHPIAWNNIGDFKARIPVERPYVSE